MSKQIITEELLLTKSEYEIEEQMVLLRWDGNVSSIFVEGGKVYHRGRNRKNNSRGERIWFRCATCGSDFTVTTNTLFHNSRLTWLQWGILFKEYLNGTTNTYTLAKEMGTTQKSAWAALNKFMDCVRTHKIIKSTTIQDLFMWGFEYKNPTSFYIPPLTSEKMSEDIKEATGRVTRIRKLNGYVPKKKVEAEKPKKTPVAVKRNPKEEGVITILKVCLENKLPIPEDFVRIYNEYIKKISVNSL